jgi:hypothetical protein
VIEQAKGAVMTVYGMTEDESCATTRTSPTSQYATSQNALAPDASPA